MRLLLQAAGQGNMMGVFNVGCAYFSGKGTHKDFTKAHQYFQQAAQADFYPAQVGDCEWIDGGMQMSSTMIPRLLSVLVSLAAGEPRSHVHAGDWRATKLQ